MDVLLHICCGPCTIYPLDVLRGEGHRVQGYFYNPNIHPYTEFARRRETLATFAGTRMLPLEIDDGYDLEEFLQGVLGTGKDRCLFCYRMRLDRVFRRARELAVEAVTTTLLYSRYQRHADIAAIGRELAERYAIPFLYRDFREGWKEGVAASKQLNMYRQGYCGCIFSEQERYRRV